MGSNNEAKESDGIYCSDHAHVPEGFFFTGVVGDDMGDNTEAWQDKDIYFGVPKESEEVLVKDGVSSASRVEEGGV